MTDVSTLLGEFMDELNAGHAPEVVDFINRAGTEADRVELAEGIEAVLAFAPDSARHPRELASGALVSPVDAERLAAMIEEATAPAVDLATRMANWRATVGASVAELASKILELGGLSTSETNVRAAASWVGKIESGAVAAEGLSARAMRAISEALGAPRAEPTFHACASSEFAFRATDEIPSDEVAGKLDEIAGVLGEALPSEPAQVDVDSWFSAD